MPLILRLARSTSRRTVSNRHMQCMIGLCLVMFATLVSGQSPATMEKDAIQRAKSVMVSSLDSSLPKVSLEFFLKYEAAGAPIDWKVTDCGEEHGNPANDRGRDFPVCVEADFVIKNGVSVAVFVSVATLAKGSAAPKFLSAVITDPTGVSHSLHRLGDLPMQIHRPVPKGPRDLPLPMGVQS